jgi:hypothetical protein
MAALTASPHIVREIDFQIFSDSDPFHAGLLSMIPLPAASMR